MEPQYPELSTRIKSTVIDSVLICLLIFACANLLDNLKNVPDWVRMALFVALFLVYEPVSMVFGSTFGNYLMGIRVRQTADTSRRINIFQALIRYPFKVLLGWISFLTVTSNPKRRAIHDLVSGTIMIKL